MPDEARPHDDSAYRKVAKAEAENCVVQGVLGADAEADKGRDSVASVDSTSLTPTHTSSLAFHGDSSVISNSNIHTDTEEHATATTTSQSTGEAQHSVAPPNHTAQHRHRAAADGTLMATVQLVPPRGPLHAPPMAIVLDADTETPYGATQSANASWGNSGQTATTTLVQTGTSRKPAHQTSNNNSNANDDGDGGGTNRSATLIKLVVVFLVLLIVGVTIVIVVLLRSEENGSTSNSNIRDIDDNDGNLNSTSQPTMVPVASPTPSTTTAAPTQLQDVSSAPTMLLVKAPEYLAMEAVLKPILMGAPSFANALDFDVTHSVIFATLYWLVFEDTEATKILNADQPSRNFDLLQRCVVASISFSTADLVAGTSNWRNQFNFLSPTSVCAWNDGNGLGVTCNDDGVIERIILPNNRLFGSFPPYIFHLTHLKELDFSTNELFGVIPSKIESFPSLETLNLSRNKFEGDLPTEIGQLQTLTSFEIEGGDTFGFIPSEIGLLVSLSSLNLGLNNFKGTIPTQFGNLVNLVDLRLNSNLLGGAVPTQLKNLRQLVTFDVSGNGMISGNIDPIFCDDPTQHSFLTESRSDCADMTADDQLPRVVCSCCTHCCDEILVCTEQTP